MADVNIEESQSNIFEMVVPENVCLYTKMTDLFDAVIKIWENTFTAAILKTVTKSDITLYPNIFVMINSKCMPRNVMFVS